MIKNEYYLEAEMKVELPQNFHEKLIDLENQILINSSLEVIEELTNLYKLGAEFYSGISIAKQKNFSFKLKELYMNKSNFKILKQHYFNSTKNNYFYEASIHDTTFTDIRNQNELPLDNLKIKRSKTFAKKDHIPSHKTFKKQNTISSKKIYSLSSFLNKNKHTFGNKRNLMNKDTYLKEISEIKEIVNIFNNNLLSCQEIVDENIDRQVSNFKQRFNKLKSKNFDIIKRNKTKRNTANISCNSDEFISFLNTERKISQENVLTPRTKISNIETILVTAPVKAFNLSLKTQSKLIQYKRKSLSVNEIFEDFTNKFHYIFFQHLCDKLFKSSITIINENYQQKKEQYFKYEDQIKELKIMSAESDTYNDQFILMINELQSQRNLDLMELELDLKSEIKGLIKFLELAQNSEFEGKLSDIIDDLINNVINIFK